MSRSKRLHYNDEQLRVLLCIAGYGPLSRTDLSKATGIEKGNLSRVVNELLSGRIIKPREGPETTGRSRGRPREYLALESPQIVQELCDELKFRKKLYELERARLDLYNNEKYWADWCEIAGDLDNNRRAAFLDKYRELKRKRLNLGADDGSFSTKAVWVEVDGRRVIVVRRYNGILYSTREVSYQSVKYWLRRLHSPMLIVMGFFMDNESVVHSKSDIAKGTGLKMTVLSQIWPKLEAQGIILATRMVGQVKMYKLNKQNDDVKELMDTVGLRKITIQRWISMQERPIPSPSVPDYSTIRT